MCTNHQLIINKRTGRHHWVKCGHCKSCLQEKANKRASRIRNHEQTSGRIGLFVTLTYDNRFIPYVLKSELHSAPVFSKNHQNVVIHRDMDVYLAHKFVNGKRVLDANTKKPKLFKYMRVGEQNNIVYPFKLYNKVQRDSLVNYHEKVDSLPSLRKNVFGKWHKVCDRVGVCYYKDFQDFIKRLYTNFKRMYGYNPVKSYWLCTEYGETYYRPHAHIIIFCEVSEKSMFEQAIRKSWLYTGNYKNAVDIQVARNIASYVASYVNCGADFPSILRNQFKPHYSTSKHFGFDNFYFALPRILDMFYKNDFTYPITRSLEGKSVIQRVPIPRYVLNRWFPQFTGCARLSSDALADCAARPLALQCLRPYTCQREDVQGCSTIRLRNSKLRFIRHEFGNSLSCEQWYAFSKYLYPYYYARIWPAYIAFLQRYMYESYDVNDSWYNYYENIDDVLSGRILSDVSDIPKPKDLMIYRHPDTQPYNVHMSAIMSQLYDKKKKRSKVSNLAMTDGIGKYV